MVVGADGSPAAQGAIAFAFEEAALRDVPLVAVCALTDAPGRLGEGRQVRRTSATWWTTRRRSTPTSRWCGGSCPAPPRAALLTATADAQLIVVGTRGRGGLDGMSLGSVAQAILHHAAGPVGVVR